MCVLIRIKNVNLFLNYEAQGLYCQLVIMSQCISGHIRQ